MAFVPRKNSRAEPKFLPGDLEKLVVVPTVPVPANAYHTFITDFKAFDVLNAQVRDEIDSQSVLVRTLPRQRFARFLSKKACLPVGRAECLEQFEVGLREAGFIGVGEILLQGLSNPLKFRVKRIDPSDDHFVPPSVKAARNSNCAVPSLTDVPKPTDQLDGGPCQGRASACGALDGVVSGTNRG